MSEQPTEVAYQWSPIKSLDAIGCDYDFSEIDSLQRQWLSIKEHREASDPDSYRAFLERLERSWSIETGIIEGLYTLDRGVTETLVQRGFNAELIDQSATNRDPEELVRILEDHRQAAIGVYQEIREGRPLSKSLIRSLHVTLTQHQPTYTAYDQFGKRFETALDRGGFKTLPNNPTRPDGRIHEYCPAVQVDSEIDNLVEWHREQRAEGLHPLLIAAWLHHAFTQIHPFQDGNGRVGRALLTWHLVRESYLSVTISRDDRETYIEALEAADTGAFDTFVDFLVRLEKKTILSALKEPEPAPDPGSLGQIIGRIAEQVQQRQNQMRSVNEVAYFLISSAIPQLQSRVDEICQSLDATGLRVKGQVVRGGPGDRENRYWPETARSARSADLELNAQESSFFVELSINSYNQLVVPRFEFVISLYHIGELLTGVMAASAFGRIVSSFVNRENEPKEVPGYYYTSESDPLTFTWLDHPEAVAPRFTAWVEKQFEIALHHWSSSISH